MLQFTLWGLSGATLTTLMLQVIKGLWQKDGQPVIQDRWAVGAAIIIGVILSFAAYLTQLYPGLYTWLDITGAGVMAGLVSCGLYSAVKSR